jgi:uncharacterized protein YndB with AHSA1/START domain
MANQVEIRLALGHSPTAVYKALTDNEMLEVWFAEVADIDLAQKRYDYWGRFTPDNPDRKGGGHRMLVAIPDEHLRYEWPTSLGPTEVDILLKPYNGGTLLTLIHSTVAAVQAEEIEASAVFPLEDFWFLSLENLRRFLDGRAVTRCDFSVHVTGDVVVAFDFEADAEQVFEALIRPDQLNQWIAYQAEVEPEVGGKFDYGWGAGDPFEVTEFEPNKKVAYMWEGVEGVFPQTVSSWTLKGSDGRTRLTLVQSGFVDDLYQDGLNIGWHFFLSWLRSLVEYESGWQPPIKRLSKGSENQYPASVVGGQGIFKL